MPELTKPQAKLLLARLDTSFRIEQGKIARKNSAIARNLMAGAIKAGSNDAERARIMRRGLTSVLEPAGETSSLIATQYYNEARAIYSSTTKKSAPFAASATILHKAKKVSTITDRTFAGLGYQIGQAVDGDLGWGSIVASATETVTQGVLNYGRGTIMENASNDDSAEGSKRSVDASGGCDFCALLAGEGVMVDSDFDGWHLFCSCTAAPAFEGGVSFQESPEVEAIMEEREEAYAAIEEKRKEVGYNDMKRQQRPAELALNTKNILKEIRSQRAEKG